MQQRTDMMRYCSAVFAERLQFIDRGAQAVIYGSRRLRTYPTQLHIKMAQNGIPIMEGHICMMKGLKVRNNLELTTI